MDGIGVDEDGCQDENPVHCRLSPELWLRIFCYLDRNDTDSCGAVCQSWRNTINVNQKYLPQRHIDYIILSSKVPDHSASFTHNRHAALQRVFSITACSGSVIRIFKIDKYFDRSCMHVTLNDPRGRMSVETIRRSLATERFFESTFVNEILYPNPENQPEQADNNAAAGALGPPPAEGSTTMKLVDFHLPPSIKTKYKIRTPPRLFFKQLNLLLHNCASINHLILYRFTLTNAFVEKFLLHVFPTPAVQHFRPSRMKRDGIKQAYADYLYGTLMRERPRNNKRTVR